MQALHLLALDPIAETTADPNSYGFRQGRSTADALAQGFCDLAKKTSAQWVLEGDIRACFDELSHAWMLSNIPMDRQTLEKWLRAGYIDQHVWHPTDAGAPQGGISSPVLCNMVLDGLEQALQEAFSPTKSGGRRTQVHLVRYADDFIITGRTQELLIHEVQPLVERFLTQRGLELSPTKTHITHIAAGFDFLGTHIRKYDGKLLMQPSKKSVKVVLGKIGTTIKQHLHAGAGNLLVQLNPIIRGWANYHRHMSSKETFAKVDHEVYQKLWGWAKRRHPTKSSGWIKKKYFDTSATRSWEYGGTSQRPNGASYTLRLARAQETPIKRHIKIQNRANPYDPEWETYFEDRVRLQMQEDLKGRRTLLYLWREQGGSCPMCHQQITTESGWNIHHLQWRVKGGKDERANLILLHPNCHRQVHSRGITVTKPRPVKGASREA